MPNFKMICKIPKLLDNDVEYHDGDIVREVVLTQEEADLLNKWMVTGCSLEPVSPVKEGPIRPFVAMNKLELQAEGEKYGLELDNLLTKVQMIDAIKEKIKELKTE
jgi:hypothetical protein